MIGLDPFYDKEYTTSLMFFFNRVFGSSMASQLDRWFEKRGAFTTFKK